MARAQRRAPQPVFPEGRDSRPITARAYRHPCGDARLTLTQAARPVKDTPGVESSIPGTEGKRAEGQKCA
jgi:hypothetical protein